MFVGGNSPQGLTSHSLRSTARLCASVISITLLIDLDSFAQIVVRDVDPREVGEVPPVIPRP